jgi:hypothetical protein
LIDRLVLLNSGQAFDFGAGSKSPDAPYQSFSEDDRERYIASSLLNKQYDHERFAFAPGIALDRLVSYARQRLWAIQKRKGYLPSFSIYLEVKDEGRFQIRLDREEVTAHETSAPLEQPYLKISGDYTLMIMLLLGHMSWNIADAALFLDYERIPNAYDPEIYVCLNYLRV